MGCSDRGRTAAGRNGATRIGVVPSAWGSTTKNIQVNASALTCLNSTNTYLTHNSYINSSSQNIYINSDFASLYRQNSGTHYWYTAPTGTAGGVISYTQSLAVGKGTTLALEGATSATGTGIAFPATQSASSNANTLDDYEEGDWTPVIADAGSGGNTGTFANAGATYTKIGRQVFIQVYMSAINTSGMTAGNTFFIRNLPFASTMNAQGNFYSYRLGRNAATVSSSISLGANATWMQIALFSTNSATTDLPLLVSNIVSGTTELIFSISYQAAT